jgi:histidinol-phosphatase (PHP family)
MYVDSHVHLQPHSVEPPPEIDLDLIHKYVAAAEANGVARIALTEHVFRFREAFQLLYGWWDDDQSNPELSANMRAYVEDEVSASLADYVRVVEEAKSQGLPVLLGLELDWVPGRADQLRTVLEPYDWDVVLGSVHWIGAWSIDSGSGLDGAEWERRDVDEVFETYVGMLRDAAETGLYDVLAHPDLPKIHGHRPTQFGPVHEALVQAAEAGPCAVELNSNGFNKPVNEAYPALSVIEGARAAGLPITLASDAHTPDRVGERFDDLAALATQAGYTEFTWYEARKPSTTAFAAPAGRTS